MSMNDLLQQVQKGLAERTRAELKTIADEVPNVSFSWLSAVARGKYESSPTYDRLQAVRDWLRRNRKKVAA